MSGRIKTMRNGLEENLKKAGSSHDWSHISKQIGMFAYTGLNEDQCNRLIKDHHIYLTKDGRISIAGLNEKNLQYVAAAFHAVSKDSKL